MLDLAQWKKVTSFTERISLQDNKDSVWPLIWPHIGGELSGKLHQYKKSFWIIPRKVCHSFFIVIFRYDSDNPRVEGDVGMAGVAIDSVEDMRVVNNILFLKVFFCDIVTR